MEAPATQAFRQIAYWRVHNCMMIVMKRMSSSSKVGKRAAQDNVQTWNFDHIQAAVDDVNQTNAIRVNLVDGPRLTGAGDQGEGY